MNKKNGQFSSWERNNICHKLKCSSVAGVTNENIFQFHKSCRDKLMKVCGIFNNSNIVTPALFIHTNAPQEKKSTIARLMCINEEH